MYRPWRGVNSSRSKNVFSESYIYTPVSSDNTAFGQTVPGIVWLTALSQRMDVKLEAKKLNLLSQSKNNRHQKTKMHCIKIDRSFRLFYEAVMHHICRIKKNKTVENKHIFQMSIFHSVIARDDLSQLWSSTNGTSHNCFRQ